MWPIVTDVTHSVVCVSVCWSHRDVLCKNDCTDLGAILGLILVGPMTSIRWRSRSDESIRSGDG